MTTLNTAAKNRLGRAKVTQADWARRWFDSPTWSGDRCGCPDDRCEGCHHEAGERCDCLDELLQE